MAVSLPIYLNQVDYNAEQERRGLSGLVAQASRGVPRSGVLGPAPDISVVSNTVRVGACHVVVGSAKGGYLLAVDSVTTAEGTLLPADTTNPRLDRVVLEVLDPDNGSGGIERRGRLRLISGTASAIPALPAVPSLAVHLGQVLTPASPSGSAVTPVVTEDPMFTAAAGAPVPVRNVTERAALDPALVRQALRLDTGGTDFVGPNGAWVSAVEGFKGSVGWNLIGVVERARISPSNVRSNLTLRLARSGGTFSIGNTSGFVGATGVVLPDDYRPSVDIDMPVTYVSSAGTWGGNAVLRISNTGAISILPVSPTTTLSITQGGYFAISAGWIS